MIKKKAAPEKTQPHKAQPRKASHRKTQPHKTLRKPGLVACALLATAGALGTAFGISAMHGEHKKEWHHQLPLRYAINDTYQDATMISKNRLLEQAWSAVAETLPGEIGYMDAHAPEINKPLTFLDFSQVDKKEFGVNHEKKYKVTVQCEDSMGLACHVVKAEEIEAKDYRSLEAAAQAAANGAAPSHNLILRATDPARLAAIFEDATSATPQLVKVLCTNPLNYSCKAVVVPSELRISPN
jgi:hypothetical protein